jgi:P27 family predicted phage terminase small subunit
MGRNKQPVRLLIAKGRKHLTKDEIEERKNTELTAPGDNVAPPDFLTTKKEKQRFTELASILLELEIMSDLDCDVLGRYIKAQDDWAAYSKLVRQMQTKLRRAIAADDAERTAYCTELLTKYEGLRSKAFTQAQTCASSIGLTITSRCKLVVPKAPEKKPENKFAQFM